MDADTSKAHAQRPAPRATARPSARPTGRYGREQLPGPTAAAAATPRVRVNGDRAAVVRQATCTPAGQEPVRPGPCPEPDAEPGPEPGADDALEQLAVIELARLRERFARPSGARWAIVYDPFRQRWHGVRGKTEWVSADTPAELEHLIDRTHSR